jgi:hypothetical protein
MGIMVGNLIGVPLMGWRWGALLIVLLGSAGPVSAGDPARARISMEAAGAFQAREAQGWLQLGQDQRAARARAEPLTPRQSRELQSIEQQERAGLAATLQTQRREIDALRLAQRRGPDPGLSGPGREARMRGLQMRQGRELDALRLRQGMGRQALGLPGGRAGRPW